MKNFLIAVGIILAGLYIFVTINHIASSTYENVAVVSSDDATVTFRTKCPYCNHQGPLYSYRISKGEEKSSIDSCEACYHLFNWKIKRS